MANRPPPKMDPASFQALQRATLQHANGFGVVSPSMIESDPLAGDLMRVQAEYRDHVRNTGGMTYEDTVTVSQPLMVTMLNSMFSWMRAANTKR